MPSANSFFASLADEKGAGRKGGGAKRGRDEKGARLVLAQYIYHPHYVDAVAVRFYDENTDGPDEGFLPLPPLVLIPNRRYDGLTPGLRPPTIDRNR